MSEEAKIALMHRHADQHMANAIVTALEIIKEARFSINKLNAITAEIEDIVTRYREARP